MTADATRAAIPGFLATIALEFWALRRSKSVVPLHTETDESNVAAPVGYETKDTAASLAMGIGSLVAGAAASKALNPVSNHIYAKRAFTLGKRRGAFVMAVLLWDFFYYWDHRLGHEHRVFWAAHVNHHSSERYNLSTALRQSWTGTVMYWVFTPMFVLGFSPKQVATAGQVNLLYQYWVHTEIIDQLPPAVEQVFNTASHHRVHHGTNQQYLDRNYAGILIVWDRWLGTFEPEDERVDYGLTKNIDTFNPIKIAFHEWAAMAADVKAARSWRDRAGYVFGRPGWAPDTALAAT